MIKKKKVLTIFSKCQHDVHSFRVGKNFQPAEQMPQLRGSSCLSPDACGHVGTQPQSHQTFWCSKRSWKSSFLCEIPWFLKIFMVNSIVLFFFLYKPPHLEIRLGRLGLGSLNLRKFPGGLVVRIRHFHCRGPQATQQSQNFFKKQKTKNTTWRELNI